jgi:hypothetical protein
LKKLLLTLLMLYGFFYFWAYTQAWSEPEILKYKVSSFEFMRISPENKRFSLQNTRTGEKTYLFFGEDIWRVCETEDCTIEKPKKKELMFKKLSDLFEIDNHQRVYDLFPACTYIAYSSGGVGHALPLRTHDCSPAKIGSSFGIDFPNHKPDIHVSFPAGDIEKTEEWKSRILDAILSSLVESKDFNILPEDIETIELLVMKDSQLETQNLGRGFRISAGSSQVRIKIGGADLVGELSKALQSLRSS